MKDQLPTVFILSGGLGSRLAALAKDIPKAMVAVAGEPFVAHQLRLLRRRGARRIVICTGHLGEYIERFVAGGAGFGLAVEYCHDGNRLLGTGGSIKNALTKFPSLETFALTYGDSYLDVDFSRAYEVFATSDKAGLMTVLHNQNRWGDSNVKFADGQVLGYEKGVKDKDFQYIDYGFSFLRREAFADLNMETFDLSIVWQSLIAREQLLGYPVPKRFFEIGTPEGLRETEAEICRRLKKKHPP